MTVNARESRLWQKVKKGLNKCFLTRIESSTINGIPDIHAVADNEVFWIELKSDEANYLFGFLLFLVLLFSFSSILTSTVPTDVNIVELCT